jgi:hypothetical protein
MKKWNALTVVALVVVASLVIVVPASAHVPQEGCTPGYWKQEQHFDSWEVYSQDDLFRETFCWDFDVDPTTADTCLVPSDADITLLQALKAKGGGENAFLRHAVAALLNAASEDVAGPDVSHVMWQVWHAYVWEGFEPVKDRLERYNDSDLGDVAECPLD